MRAHFLDLLKKDQSFPDLKTVDIDFSFDINMHRYFLRNTEKIIAEEIIELFHKGVQITEKMNMQKAKFYYYLPWVVDERITYQKLKSENKVVKKEDAPEDHTEDFLIYSKESKEQLNLEILDDND